MKVSRGIFGYVGDPTIYLQSAIVHKSIFENALSVGSTYAVSFDESLISILVVLASDGYSPPSMRFQVDRNSFARELRCKIWLDLWSKGDERFQKLHELRLHVVANGMEDKVRNARCRSGLLVEDNTRLSGIVGQRNDSLLLVASKEQS